VIRGTGTVSSRGTSRPPSCSSSARSRCSALSRTVPDGPGRGIEQLAFESTLDGFASLAFGAPTHSDDGATLRQSRFPGWVKAPDGPNTIVSRGAHAADGMVE
jgi:hypothetical protein